jgi:hypothetical protein
MGYDENVLDDDYERQDYDSGPYCVHWSDPADCDKMCKCGHKCSQHDFSDCLVENCNCDEFEDA